MCTNVHILPHKTDLDLKRTEPDSPGESIWRLNSTSGSTPAQALLNRRQWQVREDEGWQAELGCNWGSRCNVRVN